MQHRSHTENQEIPRIIQGDIAFDDRGSVSFINDFSFHGIKRFYIVQNHVAGFVRAWHGHKKENKYALVSKGSALVGAVKINNWDNPSKDNNVHRFVLSSYKPSILFIPSGYANGFKSLTNDLQIIFFSTTTLSEAKDDDFRFPARYWNIWDIEER